MNEAHIRRVLRGVSITSGVGVVVVVLTFFAWRGGFMEGRVASLLFLASTLLIGGGVMFVAATIPYIPKVTPLLVTGALLAIMATALDVIDDYAISAKLPIIGHEGRWHMPHFDDGLFFSGMGLIVCCAYLAILDAGIARIRLTAEVEEKSLAIQEARRYALALAQSEQVARRQLSEIQHLYQFAPAGMCFVDSQLRFQRVNHHFAKLDGVSVHDHLGQPVASAVPIVGEELAEWCGEVLRTGTPLHGAELVFSRESVSSAQRGGEAATWLVSIIPVLGEKGRAGMQMVVQDITGLRAGERARHQLGEQLRQTQRARAIGVLTTVAAQDAGKLLTAILENAGVALDQEQISPRAHRLLEDIRRDAGNCAEITRHMRAQAEHRAVQLVPLALDDLVREAVPHLESSVVKWGELRQEITPTSAIVLADAAQVRQALVNLVGYAGEAWMGGGGGGGAMVTVRTGLRHCEPEEFVNRWPYAPIAPGEYAYIELSANRPGMEPATVTGFFAPKHATTCTGRELGLAEAVGVTRMHQGVIDVVSTPESGCAFRMLLPILEKKTLPQSAGLAAPESDEVMVLIIDDEESIRAVLTEVITDMGYVPVPAVNGQDALLSYLEYRDRVKVVLLDLSMPGMDGRATFQALRAEGCAAPVILLSGYAENQVGMDESRAFDYFRFVQKPFTHDILSEAVRAALFGAR